MIISAPPSVPSSIVAICNNNQDSSNPWQPMHTAGISLRAYNLRMDIGAPITSFPDIASTVHSLVTGNNNNNNNEEKRMINPLYPKIYFGLDFAD